MSPTTIVHRLSELSRADLPTAGGKGANLGEMLRLGLPVPPGFVVSTQAYAEQARAWGLAERLGAHLAASDDHAAASAAEELFRSGAMLASVEGAIRAAYRELGAARVAVRSSATAEDLADASFAGQQETFLDVASEDEALASIRRCWASLYSPRALHYRRARGIAHLSVEIAVVVQQMVPADAAGVLFTVDPVKQRSDWMLLSAAPGLGEAIVSGHRRGDTYRVRREPRGGGGPQAGSPAQRGALAIVDRDLESPGRPALGDAELLELGRLGLSLEAHFGCPQDVEFAVASGRVFLLQSRPITTLGAAELEPIEPAPTDRMDEALERFPIAPRPLDHWAIKNNLRAFIHALRHMGFAVSDADAQEPPAHVWRETLLLPKPRPTVRLLGAPAKLAACFNHDLSAWWSGEPLSQLLAASQPVDCARLGDAELIERTDHVAEVYGDVMGQRFERGPSFMLGTAALSLAVRLAVGKARAPALLADLLGGIRTRTSEANRALFRVAKQAERAGPDVAEAIRSGRTEELRATEAGRACLAAVDAFLDAYGHREGVGPYLSTPTWKNDPEPVWCLLRSFMALSEFPDDGGVARYTTALLQIERRLGWVPGLARAFRALTEHVRAATVFREDSHFDLTRPLSAMQTLVAELGRRLHDRGLLPTATDAFQLSEQEAKAWLLGRAPPKEEIEALLKRRRATYQVVNTRWQQQRIQGGGTGDELRGTGASSGVVRARARIVRGEHQFDRLRPGEILVCAYTNPSWTPLFALAAGVVTDTGGAGSHAAIVAREYGIPAVMGASGATERIADGQQILVDGAEGLVKLLPGSDTSAATGLLAQP
ncbi:PEP/pyruvate-binding domain-containing protein [Sorangium sp. So ce136]|uniref:PEP/pyruvate-binding domain-containing protein n=1 Tax=Sorangium sp. So ce136 TaxID=3133284 RepID=UPI003F0E1C43